MASDMRLFTTLNLRSPLSAIAIPEIPPVTDSAAADVDGKFRPPGAVMHA